MIEVEILNLKKEYDKPVFNNFSCNFKSPGFNLIKGSNGSGKSTLIQILAGLIPFSDGEIRYYKDREPTTLKEIISKTGIISPNVSFYDNLSVSENIALITHDKTKFHLIMKDIQKLNISGKSKYKTLSSGMKIKLKAAVCFSGEKEFFLLDEPFVNLDKNGRNYIEHNIYLNKSKLIICASNIQAIDQFSDKEINIDK